MTYPDPTTADKFPKRFLIALLAMAPAIIAFLILRMRYVNLVFSDPQGAGWIVILGPAYLMMYIFDVAIITMPLAYIFATSNLGKKIGVFFAFSLFLIVYISIIGEMKPAGSNSNSPNLSETYYMPLAHFASLCFVLCMFTMLVFFGQSKETSVYDSQSAGSGDD